MYTGVGCGIKRAAGFGICRIERHASLLPDKIVSFSSLLKAVTETIILVQYGVSPINTTFVQQCTNRDWER